MRFFQQLCDPQRKGSLSANARDVRNRFFNRLLSSLSRPLTILDIGGTEAYWAAVGLYDPRDIHIYLLNLQRQATSRPGFTAIEGDARDLNRFRNCEFDVVFSNSMIEHVASITEQKKIADGMRRVGHRYFVQTPNVYFPIEPHFLFPCFQFLPIQIRIWIATRIRCGWIDCRNDPVGARRHISSIRLLSERELKVLFPEATIYRERFCGLTKSLTAYHGWSPDLS